MPTLQCPLDRALAKAKKHASPRWYKAALATVRRLARKRPRLTSGDVLDALEAREVHTHNRRAIGPVMLDAQRLGWIESGGLIRQSNGYSRAATTLWFSKLYVAPTPDTAYSAH